MLVLGFLSKSNQIAAAAVAVAISWCFSILWFWASSDDGLTWGYAIVDAGLAIYFWRQSRRRHFPVPLFYIHAILVCYFVYVSVLHLNTWFWIASFVNRLFDLELLYIGGCAIFRIRALRRKRQGAPEARPDAQSPFLVALFEELGPAPFRPALPRAAVIRV